MLFGLFGDFHTAQHAGDFVDAFGIAQFANTGPGGVVTGKLGDL